MLSISNLPEDVLLVIFDEYIWTYRDSPRRLLFVCSRWHALASDTPTLWGNIIYTDSNAHYEAFYDRGLVCGTPKGLRKAILRTKSSPFELTLSFLSPPVSLNPEHWNVIDPVWFSERCRVLRLKGNYTIDPTALPFLQDLSHLIEFDVSHLILYTNVKDRLAKFLRIVEDTAPTLRRLSLKPYYPSISLKSYPSLTARLLFLELRMRRRGDLGVDLQGATALKQLTVTARRVEATSSTDLSAIVSLNRLSTINCPLHALPGALYANITNLCVRYSHITTIQDGWTITLYRLNDLIITNRWTPLTMILAPNLQSLTLRAENLEDELILISDILTTSLRPKRLDLDVVIEEADLVKVLRDKWHDLEELRIVYVIPGQLYDNTLHQAFIGANILPPVCPNLRRFYVVATLPSNSQLKSQSEELLKQLGQQLPSRKAVKELSYGWSPEPEPSDSESQDGHIHQFDPLNTNWIDLHSSL